MEERNNKFISFFDRLNLEKISNNRMEKHKRRNQEMREDKIHPDFINSDEIMSSKVNFELLKESYYYIISKQMIEDKNKTKHYLKVFRREITKISISTDVINSLIHNKKEFFEVLSLNLFDFKNSEIQLESLWIMNNLSTMQNESIRNELINISTYLIQFLNEGKNINNSGAKNMVLEKYFSLLGNLFIDSPGVLNLFLNNNILEILTLYLNSSVRTLRTVVLWTLNNIISNFLRDEEKMNIISSILQKKNINYYLKFLIINYDISKSFEECFEFYWFLSFLSQMENIFINNENKLSLFINSAYNENLFQPILRVLGNILSSPYEINEIKQFIMKEISNSNNPLLYILKLRITEQYTPVIKEIIWFIKNVSIINKDFFLIIVMPIIPIFLNYVDKILMYQKHNSLYQFFTVISTNSNIYESEFYWIFSDLTFLCYLYITNSSCSIDLKEISPFLKNLIECIYFTRNDLKLKLFVYEIMKFIIKSVSIDCQKDEIFLNEIESKIQYYPNVFSEEDLLMTLSEMKLRIERANIIY